MSAGQSLAQGQAYLGGASLAAADGEYEECTARALLAAAWILDAIAVELGVPELPAPESSSPADMNAAPG